VREIARELGCHHWSIYAALNRRALDRSPTGPPRLSNHPENVTAIRAHNGTKVRRLHELGYLSPRIAHLLALDLDEVLDFLSRIRPRRADAPLRRPRTRREQDGLRPRRIRRPAPPKPPTWKRTDARNDSAGCTSPTTELPAIAAAELVVDEAVAELPARPATENPPADGPAWGYHQHRFAAGERHGRSKLTAVDAREIRRLHAAGRSIYSLAPQFNISKSAIRAIVRFETWQDA